MTRFVVTLMLFVLAVMPIAAFEWSAVTTRVTRSLVALTTTEGAIYCTGFVIDAKRDFVMTAQHCVNHDRGVLIDGKATWIVWADADLDLAILHTPGNTQPDLKPGKPVRAGQSIAALGFGYGFPVGTFRSGDVGSIGAVLEGLTGKWLVTTFALIPGMSGGPMVNTKGRVIAINLRGNEVMGFGRSIADIYQATHDFWRQAP